MSLTRVFVKRAMLSAARYTGVNRAFRVTLGRNKVLVLCYHGVVADDHSPEEFLYRNTVSVRDFGLQLQFLTRNFHPIGIRELMDFVRAGRALKPRSTLVTFDDGYNNNLRNASPLLSKYGVPAMFAVTTGYVGGSDVLWPDEVNLRVLGWPLAAIPYPLPFCPFDGVQVPPEMSARIELADRIRAACKNVSDEIRRAYLNVLREVPCHTLEDRDRELFDFLSWDDVRSLVKGGFDIASHTVSHPILSRIDSQQLDYELKESKTCIETETGTTCSCLVYPNGKKSDFSNEVQVAARCAGYDIAFSLTGAYATVRKDCFTFSRIVVPGHQPPTVFESRASGLRT
jgi:peptidoglycan/xylan/chitin deacetylase (PgdA/CDA1 family)